MNRLVNLAIPPRTLPRMNFDDGIPDDCRTFVVVPTLLLSRGEVEKLLERLEIHYLANRDPNLLFRASHRLSRFRHAGRATPDAPGLPSTASARSIERYANGHSPFISSIARW